MARRLQLAGPKHRYGYQKINQSADINNLNGQIGKHSKVMTIDSEWQWSVASDATIVHALLEASDRRSATESAPAPLRNLARTAHLVAAGAVQLLTIEGSAAAMITLVDNPPFDLDGIPFDKVERPLYMQRFSVDEGAVKRFGALPAIATLRRAREIADQQGMEALRCEINPDLAAIRKLLASFGFHEVGQRDGRPARAYMQHLLVS